ncbi:MAG: bifunctional folylpolyglutamate synthase/dihydrofolate synthase [Slackia sp.]
MANRYDFDPKTYLQQGAWADVKLGLHRTEELLERLGNPQDSLKIVHVAGTNGKGSTSAFVAGILQAAGYTTGLFTSPYILRFNERIQIGRVDISDEDLLEVAADVRDQALLMDEAPTAFELLTAAALHYFSQKRCDVVVLEVGLGGRLDSTNVVTPLLSVITPIALDHVAVLGDTIAEIAAEKAGIIKSGIDVLSYPQHSDAAAVIEKRAAELGCTVRTPRFSLVDAHAEGLTQVFSYDGIEDVHLRLAGVYQPYNAAMAVEAARILRGKGFDIPDSAIKNGLEVTTWPARFEVVAHRPTTIVDGGHNEQGARVLAKSLQEYFPEGGVTFVMSVLRDKDYRAMIECVLPFARRVFVAAPPDNDRALSADELADAIREVQKEKGSAYASCVAEAFVESCPSVHLAVLRARETAGSDGVVCCFGSLYSVQETMEALV